MEKRKWENIKSTNVETSLLGFGCMRFKTIDGEIDEEKALALVDKAYKSGVNYFDTAYPYHDGESERLIGRILSKYPRDSFYLADKFPGHGDASIMHIFLSGVNKFVDTDHISRHIQKKHIFIELVFFQINVQLYMSPNAINYHETIETARMTERAVSFGHLDIYDIKVITKSDRW